MLKGELRLEQPPRCLGSDHLPFLFYLPSRFFRALDRPARFQGFAECYNLWLDQLGPARPSRLFHMVDLSWDSSRQSCNLGRLEPFCFRHRFFSLFPRIAAFRGFYLFSAALLPMTEI